MRTRSQLQYTSRSMMILASSLLFGISSTISGGVLFDVDLTKGSPAKSGITVTGGQFNNGWKQTASGNQIVLDAGYKIKNGALEVTFVASASPLTSSTVDKIVYAGAWETAPFTGENPGARAHIRFIKIRDCFVEIKAKENTYDRTEGESRLGKHADWLKNLNIAITMKAEWKNGKLTYFGPFGPVSRPNPNIQNMRYVVIGTDQKYAGMIPAFTYKRIVVQDYDKQTTTTIARQADSPASIFRIADRYAFDPVVFSISGRALKVRSRNEPGFGKNSPGLFIFQNHNRILLHTGADSQ